MFQQVSSGRQWYLHAIYTIRSSHTSTRGIGKRSIVAENSHFVNSVSKRAVDGKAKQLAQGAALLRSIRLNYDDEQHDDMSVNNRGRISEKMKGDESSSLSLKWVLIVVAAICIILMVIVIVLVMLYRRKSPPVTTAVAIHGDQTQGTEV